MRESPMKLLHRVRNKIRETHYSIRTEEAYCEQTRRCIRFRDQNTSRTWREWR